MEESGLFVFEIFMFFSKHSKQLFSAHLPCPFGECKLFFPAYCGNRLSNGRPPKSHGHNYYHQPKMLRELPHLCGYHVSVSPWGLPSTPPSPSTPSPYTPHDHEGSGCCSISAGVRPCGPQEVSPSSLAPLSLQPGVFWPSSITTWVVEKQSCQNIANYEPLTWNTYPPSCQELGGNSMHRDAKFKGGLIMIVFVGFIFITRIFVKQLTLYYLKQIKSYLAGVNTSYSFTNHRSSCWRS